MPAFQFLNGIDLNKKQILNMALQNLASAPSDPTVAQMYWNTTDDTAYVYDGTQWVDMLQSGGDVTQAEFDNHNTRHESGGGDEVALGNLNGIITDTQHGDRSGGSLHADATSSADGFMPSGDKSKLDNATNTNTSSTLVIRDSNGNFRAAEPVDANDVAIKSYVDASAAGLDPKDSVRVATTANITLSDTQTIDGVSLSDGDRVLVKDQSTASENGIYDVVAGGSWLRSSDADDDTEVSPGLFTFVEEGTDNANTGWVLSTNGDITLGTTDLTFAIFARPGDYTAGTGLDKNGMEFSISDTYSGQSSIVTLGTITTGTWEGSTIAIAQGGTGATDADTARTNLGATGKYAETIGDGSATSFTINHTLGTKDVTVSIRYAGGTQEEVGAWWQVSDSNNINVEFSDAPGTDEFRVTVIG